MKDASMVLVECDNCMEVNCMDQQADEEFAECSCIGASVHTGSLACSGVVVIVAAIVSWHGVVNAPGLLGRPSSITYEAPPNSLSEVAWKRLETNFPLLSRISDAQVLMVIKSVDGVSSVLTDDVERFSLNVSDCVKTDWRTKDLDPVVTGYFTGSDERLNLKPKGDTLRHGYVSPDETMTLVDLIGMGTPPASKHLAAWMVRENVIAFLSDFVKYPPKGTKVMLAGNPVTSHDASQDHSIEMLLHAEICVIPIALAVLALLVWHLRLLLIPPIVLAVSFLASVCAVTPVTWVMPFSTDIPPAMVSLVIALSLDYSLFFLTRFNENRALLLTIQDNVDVMMRHTTHTIAVSGLLIAIAFFGALAIPERNLQSAGVCLGVTTLACVVVNTTLTPSLLLIFGKMLTQPLCLPEHKIQRHTSLASAETERLALITSIDPKEQMMHRESGWFWLMRQIEKAPRCAVALVFLAFSPLLIHLPQLHASADAYAMLPSTLPSIEATRAVVAEGFPFGRFEPFTVVVDWKEWQDTKDWHDTMTLPNGNVSSMLCKFAFESMLDLSDMMDSYGNISTMLGPTWMMDKRIGWNEAHKMYNAMPGSGHMEDRRLYTAILTTHVTENAAVLQMHTMFPARASGAASWVVGARDVLNQWERDHPQFQATLSGGATSEADIRDAVMGAMPAYVGTTVLGVMLMVLLLFRSLLLPLRLAFALLFTLAGTFSFAVVVYQTPLMHGIWPWLANYNGLTYESVPIATCIAVALGLDYDIFLISRIFEFRQQGMSDRESIVWGVSKTGSIISGAGVIMALAFSGLLFSPKLMHNQFALLLITSVLLDTFVVRTVLVPALMLSAGPWNWWPLKMPEPFEAEDRISQRQIAQLRSGGSRSTRQISIDADDNLTARSRHSLESGQRLK